MHPSPIDRYDHPRDFAGYAGRTPAAYWPQEDARLALSLVINVEDGAERHRSEGDDTEDHNAHWVRDVPHESGNPSLESGFDYGARAGIWRVLRILDDTGVPATAFVCGRALERNPAIGRALADRGIEIVDHGLRWEPHNDLTADELRERIDASAGIIRRITGEDPESWYSKDGHSRASMKEMISRGYSHDSNCFNDDYPHMPDGRRGPVTIPYAGDTNDSQLLNTIATGAQFRRVLDDAVDTLLSEDAQGAKVLSIGLHPRWIGRPAYAGALRGFIEHMKTTPGVVFAQRRQIAAWWRSMVTEE